MRVQQAYKKAILQEAHAFRAHVIKAFDSSGKSNGKPWAPNTEGVRRAKKGKSKPLINAGDLRRSITVVSRGTDAFIGVLNRRTRKGGGPMVDIARVHEHGKVIVIPVTKAMINFLHARARELGLPPGGGQGKLKEGGILIIEIPRRSFINDTANRHMKSRDVRDRVLSRIADELGPGWDHLASSVI